MNYIDIIKRQSVVVNEGSGILVRPVVGEHLYVFTAYHVIQNCDDQDIQLSLASDLKDEDFNYKVVKSYHSDENEDAAIIEIETTYQVQQLYLCENYNECLHCYHFGFPEVRRNNDEAHSDFIDYSIKEFGQKLNGRFLEYEYDKFHQQSELKECSGGAIMDNEFHLLGIHKGISNKDGKEYNGKCICIPIEIFKKIIRNEEKLKCILYLDLSSFDSFTPKAFKPPTNSKRKAEDLKSLLLDINLLLQEINKLSPQEIYNSLQAAKKAWGDKEDIHDYEEDTWIELVRYLVGIRLLRGLELQNDNICLIADKLRFIYSDENFEIDEARNMIKPSVLGNIKKDTIVFVGGLHTSDYQYDVLPSERKVPDIIRAKIEKDGLDIASGGRNYLAFVTFVNNKVFVDTMDYNAKKIGENNDDSLAYYTKLLKEVIYGTSGDL